MEASSKRERSAFPLFSGLSDPLLIAQGSMGEVWRVFDETDKVIRAFKTLSDDMLDDKWIARCLRQEYDLARRFQHRNLVTAHRWFEEKGRPGFTMDFVDGEELKVLLHERSFDFADRFALVRGVVDAVHCLHTLDSSNWIIHCDIKPENILVRTRSAGEPLTRGDAVLIDYGTAVVTPNRPKLFHPAKIREFFTRQRVVGGSYLYMSPEQTEAGPMDPRSDVYSLGCFMYEVFAGRPPFLSQLAEQRNGHVGLDDPTLDREELAVLHREQEPDDPRYHNPDLQEGLAQIILRCLQKEPTRRFQTVFALASELSKIRVYRGEAILFDEEPITDLRKGVLIGVRGTFKGLRKMITDEGITIGRHTTLDNDLTLAEDDKLVSGRHCQISRSGDTYVIEDLDSRNGTYVNERKIKRHVLQAGDKIRFGHNIFRFELAV